MRKLLVLSSGYCSVSEMSQLYSWLHGNSGDPSRGMLYVNESPSLRAPCNSVVYRWHYCYYPIRREYDLQVVFGAFRAANDGSNTINSVEQYHLGSGITSSTWTGGKVVSRVTQSTCKSRNIFRSAKTTE